MPNKLNEKLDEIENVNDYHENDPHKLIPKFSSQISSINKQQNYTFMWART